MSENQLRGKTAANRDNQGDDERFDVTKSFVLEEEHDQHVERGDDTTPDERNPEEQIERDGRADHFGQIAGGDRDLAKDPEET